MAPSVSLRGCFEAREAGKRTTVKEKEPFKGTYIKHVPLKKVGCSLTLDPKPQTLQGTLPLREPDYRPLKGTLFFQMLPSQTPTINLKPTPNPLKEPKKGT